MANPATQKNKTGALGAAAARRAAAAQSAPEKEPELDESFGEDEAEPEASKPAVAPAPPAAEPEIRTRKNDVRTRKDQKVAETKVKIVPTHDFVLDKNGNKIKDEDGDDMRYASGDHPQVGYVNENGVLFPNGFKFRGGHVMNGLVVLNTCPRCGSRQSIDEALEGACANLKAGPEKQKCGFNMHRELAEYHPDDLE